MNECGYLLGFRVRRSTVAGMNPPRHAPDGKKRRDMAPGIWNESKRAVNTLLR